MIFSRRATTNVVYDDRRLRMQMTRWTSLCTWREHDSYRWSQSW